MNFFYQLYYGIVNSLSSPTRLIESIAQAPPTRRAFVFGVPAVLVGFLAISSYIWAQMVGIDNRIASYSHDAEEARDRAAQVITLIKYRAAGDENTEIPPNLKKEIEPEILEYTVKELEEKREEYLNQWEIYLHKLIEMDGTQDKWKLELAKVASQRGKQQLVFSLMDQLAPIDRPGNKDAQFKRGQNYLSQKVYDRAAKHFENALQSDSEFVAARVNLIIALINQKKFPEAKRHIEEIFEEQLVNYPILVNLARVVYKNIDGDAGETDVLNTAVVKLKDKVRLNPNNRRLWELLLNCYAGLGNYEEAEKMILAVQKSVDRNSAEVESHKRRLSQLYSAWALTNAIKTDNYQPEKNFELLRKSYTQFPDNQLTLRQIAVVALQAEEEYALKARELYDPLADTDPPAGVHIEISHYYLLKMEEARDAKNEEEEKRFRQLAIKELRDAFDKMPNDDQIRNNLAFLLIQEGENRIDEALRLAEKAVENSSKRMSTKNLSNFYDTLGTVQMAKAIALSKTEQLNSQKYFLEAISSFKKARVGRPDNLKLLQAQAVCQEAVGNLPAAKKLRERIEAIKARDQKKDN